MRDSIIFYRSFMESFAELPDQDRLIMYDAVLKYGLYGEDPELDGVHEALFKLVKPQLDANTRRYENSLKGGRKPKANQTETKPKPKANQTEPNLQNSKPNVNDNDNDNENEKVNGNVAGLATSQNTAGNLPLSLISYLNSKTGSKYQADANVTRMIIGLLGQGYSEADMRTVIDRKCAEWSDDAKMKSYLRPSTLFGDKFGEYLNAPESEKAEQERTERQRKTELLTELDQKRAELKEIETRMNEIKEGGDDYIAACHDELSDLRLQKAIREDVISSLESRTGAVAV